MLPIKDKLCLLLQRILSFVLFPILYFGVWFWMVVIQGYRVPHIRSLRKQYRQIQQAHPGPLLLCPNHLTFIDSLILIWALSPAWRYIVSYKRFPWNLPKQTHVENNLLFKLVCYLGKCIYIPLDKTKTKQAMLKAKYLMDLKQDFMIFPEGTRSNTGRINTTNYIYGVGQLILDTPELTVLSIYLRGKHQQKASVFPQKKDVFDIQLEVIKPSTTLSGRRAMRDIASQLIEQLVKMEAQHFS